MGRHTCTESCSSCNPVTGGESQLLSVKLKRKIQQETSIHLLGWEEKLQENNLSLFVNVPECTATLTQQL